MPEAFVHPIILYDGSAPPTDYNEPLERVLWSCVKFWNMYSYYPGFGSIKLWGPDHNVDVLAENPWGQVWQQTEGLRAGYPQHHKFLVFLKGWNHRAYVGWGGGNLAVVGDYALDRLLTHGTPEGLWDDNLVAGLINHELGHCFGMAHSTSARADVMWEWWRYPDVFLDTEIPAAQLGPAILPCTTPI